MKKNLLSITLTVFFLLLVGCGVAPEEAPAVEAVEVTNPATHAVKTEPLLITSVEEVPSALQASLREGRALVGRYEAEPLPNGQLVLKLKSTPCSPSLAVADKGGEGVNNITADGGQTSLIISAGEIPGIGPASPAETHAAAALFETELLPNGEVSIRLKVTSGAGDCTC